MAEIDWKNHTAAEIVRALRSAPRVALPWRITRGGIAYRQSPAGEDVASAWTTEVGDPRYCVDGTWEGGGAYGSGLDAAKRAADARLLANGWLLLNEDDDG